MKYTVVQWVGEDGAVSVVSEKDITSPEDEIVEGGEDDERREQQG